MVDESNDGTESAADAALVVPSGYDPSEHLPTNLLLLPVAQTTLFPGMLVPLILPEGKLVKSVDAALAGDGHLGVVLSRNPGDGAIATGPNTSFTGLPADGTVASSEGPRVKTKRLVKEGAFYPYGVVAKVLKRINLPDNQVSVLVSGLQRFHVDEILAAAPDVRARVSYIKEIVQKGNELEALVRSALVQFKQLAKDNPLISEEVRVALVNIDGPGKLADFMASVLIRDVGDYQDFLAAAGVKERLHRLLLLLKREQDVQTVQRKIHDDINQKVSGAQREFYLTEQLKLIQKELGRNADEKTKLFEKFRERLSGRPIPAEVKRRIDEEFEKLQTVGEQSSEYSVSVNYLDWVTALPWGLRSPDVLSLRSAKKVLDEDHYGLKDVKSRILEFLAVKKLKGSAEGSILCFVGPPGTGKTSLGKSIARALGRKFFRFSVGGMRDEAEIKGHRRTYVGAMPGKFIQGMKRAGTQNPVFLIDEIDKMGTGWAAGGDPASALLELLDPEQHKEFVDHYLDIPFDCTEVFFIVTANSTDTIPPALLDRLEIIPLHGYTDNEKRKIGRQYLLPKQLKKNALKASQLKVTDDGLKRLIEHYAREAGVRNLEKQIAKMCRKVAFRVATGRGATVVVDSDKNLEHLLGQPPFSPEKSLTDLPAGTATGLAWTQYGGEVLFVESLVVPGRGGLMLTGQLGKVMQESGNIAYSFVRERAKALDLPRHYFERHTIHVHVPAGATPKDGPSAGVTLAASLFSLLSRRPLPPRVAMTGEMTLTGRVLPVGGVKEKLLAAKRAGVQTVLLPKENWKDLKEIEPEIKAGLKLVRMGTVDDCLRYLFHGPSGI